jgi:hypothetical protein
MHAPTSSVKACALADLPAPAMAASVYASRLVLVAGLFTAVEFTVELAAAADARTWLITTPPCSRAWRRRRGAAVGPPSAGDRPHLSHQRALPATVHKKSRTEMLPRRRGCAEGQAHACYQLAPIVPRTRASFAYCQLLPTAGHATHLVARYGGEVGGWDCRGAHGGSDPAVSGLEYGLTP